MTNGFALNYNKFFENILLCKTLSKKQLSERCQKHCRRTAERRKDGKLAMPSLNPWNVSMSVTKVESQTVYSSH